VFSQFPFLIMNERLNHNYFIVNWRMESTFVITYLMVRISVNSVKYRQQTGNLIYLAQWDVVCLHITGVVLYGGKSDDRTD
jgi:hypothetical protein